MDAILPDIFDDTAEIVQYFPRPECFRDDGTSCQSVFSGVIGTGGFQDVCREFGVKLHGKGAGSITQHLAGILFRCGQHVTAGRWHQNALLVEKIRREPVGKTVQQQVVPAFFSSASR